MARLKAKEAQEILSLVAAISPPTKSDIARVRVAALTCKSVEEFAQFLELDLIVFKQWCKLSYEYQRAVDTWRDHATDEIEIALAKKAIGFKKTLKRDVLTKAGTVETLHIETYYPPDTAAAQFWLKNRKKEDWQDKTEVDINVQANIRAWLIAAGEEVPEAIEGQHRFVGMTEGSDPLIEVNNVEPLNVIDNDVEPSNVFEPLNTSKIDEPLNTTDLEPLNITPTVIEQEPVAKVQNNDPNWSLFNDE